MKVGKKAAITQQKYKIRNEDNKNEKARATKISIAKE